VPFAATSRDWADGQGRAKGEGMRLVGRTSRHLAVGVCADGDHKDMKMGSDPTTVTFLAANFSGVF